MPNRTALLYTGFTQGVSRQILACTTCSAAKKQRWGQRLDKNTHGLLRLLVFKEILQLNNEGYIYLNDYHMSFDSILKIDL